MFKLLDSQSDRHIVQIFNENQTHLVTTILAIPNYRLQPTGHSVFAFWENTPRPASRPFAPGSLHPGDNFGQEFLNSRLRFAERQRRHERTEDAGDLLEGGK